MASTLIQLFRIACYESDGENLGDLIGYKSTDGDYVDGRDDDRIQYYSSTQLAGQYIDNSDELELQMRDVIESVCFDTEDTLDLNIKSK